MVSLVTVGIPLIGHRKLTPPLGSVKPLTPSCRDPLIRKSNQWRVAGAIDNATERAPEREKLFSSFEGMWCCCLREPMQLYCSVGLKGGISWFDINLCSAPAFLLVSILFCPIIILFVSHWYCMCIDCLRKRSVLCERANRILQHVQLHLIRISTSVLFICQAVSVRQHMVSCSLSCKNVSLFIRGWCWFSEKQKKVRLKLLARQCQEYVCDLWRKAVFCKLVCS